MRCQGQKHNKDGSSRPCRDEAGPSGYCLGCNASRNRNANRDGWGEIVIPPRDVCYVYGRARDKQREV